MTRRDASVRGRLRTSARTRPRNAAPRGWRRRRERSPGDGADVSSVALGEAVNRGAIAASPPPIARLALSARARARSALRLRVRCDIVLAPGTRPALLPTQPSRRPCSVWDTGAPSEKAGGMERVARVNARASRALSHERCSRTPSRVLPRAPSDVPNGARKFIGGEQNCTD